MNFFQKMFQVPQTRQMNQPKMFRKKSPSDELFLNFSAKVQNLTVLSFIYMIRIRFFWARGINSEWVSGGTVLHVREIQDCDLVFLSMKICECSMPISRLMWYFASPICLWMFRSSHERSPWNGVGLVLPPSVCWLRRNTSTSWFLTCLVLNIRKACFIGSAVRRICITCLVSDSYCIMYWRNFLIVTSDVAGGIE